MSKGKMPFMTLRKHTVEKPIVNPVFSIVIILIINLIRGSRAI